MQHKKRNLEKRIFLPWTAAALLGVSDHGFMWGRSCSSPFHLAQANRNMHVALLSLFFLSWFLETSKQTPRNVIIDFRKEKCAVTNYYWEQSYNYSHIKSSLFANKFQNWTCWCTLYIHVLHVLLSQQAPSLSQTNITSRLTVEDYNKITSGESPKAARPHPWQLEPTANDRSQLAHNANETLHGCHIRLKTLQIRGVERTRTRI